MNFCDQKSSDVDQNIFKDVSTIYIKFPLVSFLYLYYCSSLLFFFCLRGVISSITEEESFADCPPVLKIKGAWLTDHKARGKWHFCVTSCHNCLLVVSNLVHVSWPTKVCVAHRKYLRFLDWSELVLVHIFTLTLHVLLMYPESGGGRLQKFTRTPCYLEVVNSSDVCQHDEQDERPPNPKLVVLWESTGACHQPEKQVLRAH